MPGLRLRGFAAWLRRQEPEATCGLPGNLVHCPLARYLRMTTGQRVIVYGDTYVAFAKWSQYSPMQQRRLRPWAVAFRRLVDGADDQPISVAQARAYLQRSLEEGHGEGTTLRARGGPSAR